MKKRVTAIGLCFLVLLSVVGCDGSEGNHEITLSLAYGERVGTYSGDMVDGVPNGNGVFKSKNSAGEEWTYEGEFKNGHFDGEGKTTWSGGQIEIGTYRDDVIVPMTGNQLKRLYTSPQEFKNHYVEITGKVFTAPEYDGDGVCFQMWADIKNAENNTIVYIFDRDFDVEQDDYIRVVGLVGDPFTGTNAFGGTVTAPTVVASEYEVLSYIDAVSPTKKMIETNQRVTQHGYSVTLEKVELADQETRVYLKIDNQGSDKFNVYSFNALITQDGRQFEEESNWEADYPEIQSGLLVGNSTEGIIAFPPIEEKDFTLVVEGRSENWHEDFSPFTFDVGI